MGVITHAALRRAMAVNARATREVGTRRVVGMQGSGRVIVVESESCEGNKAIANSSGLSFGSNARVLVAVRGGQAVEVIGRPPSGAGSALPPREVAKTVTTTAKPVVEVVPLLALRATAFAGGNLTINIAAFDGAEFVETLFTGIVLSGLESGIGEDSARQQLMTARSVTGVDGVPDGSIVLCVEEGPIGDGNVQPTIHLINITTGAVNSRKFVPTEIVAPELPAALDDSPLDRHCLGIDYFGDEFYVTFIGDATDGNDGEIFQVAKFPPAMASETILGGVGIEGDQLFGVVHFAADSIVKVGSLGNWDRMEYTVGHTADYVLSSKPQPGDGRDEGDLRTHPRDLGLASDADHRTIGAGADDSIQVFEVTDLADAVANGWSSQGLPTAECFIQLRNGSRVGGYDYNAARDEIVAFPHALSAGAASSVALIPITATVWGDATFLEMETGDFDMDAVISDARAT